MLVILRTLTLGATAGTLFAAVLSALPIRLGSRLALGAGIGAWISLIVALAGSGAVKASPLVVPALFALPLIAAGLAASSAPARSAMMAIPVPTIVALNAWRVLGVFMVLAAVAGTMSGPFPYAAGIGDIVTGIFALPVARVAARNLRDVRVLEWNIFGALDLVVAVALGITYAQSGSAEMTTLPWALIPLVLVPTYLIGHALVFAHLRAAAPVKSGPQTTLVQA
ncbi:MAG TPA: hypothetical protein VFE36_01710 [Candidatus Baltobacteraceae bacterium]|jgi:hypothetical protein|nr:hypothetical protein [Candidatus Baltobacteraceae bacterium]